VTSDESMTLTGDDVVARFVVGWPSVRGKQSHRKLGEYRVHLASLLDKGVEQ
jgi:hypothetical protein